MLIRITGGSSGIAEYLVSGQKQDRELTRDELDDRVFLDGDLELTDSIIKGMDKKGERYLHITLAFKEDSLSKEMLTNITSDFKQFTMSAYDADEFNFYAEAHLPKIKSYTNRQTGELVERKPHIHVVIPEQNLLTGQNLNPFGRVEQQVKFLEAFQEHANAKYGLASPKDNRRAEFTSESEMISRYKGDLFHGSAKELKERILNDVLEKKINDYDSFKKIVATHGGTRTRNEGQATEYLNLKPENTAKGINLKDYVFSREFIGKTEAEKRHFLANEGLNKYESQKPAKPTAPELEARLKEWHEVRAKELKYINSGNRKLYTNYKNADNETKQTILADRAKTFYLKHRGEFRGRENETFDLSKTQKSQASSEEKIINTDNVTSQLITEAENAKLEAKATTVAEFAQIKRELNASQLLAHLSQTHGVIPDKYEVTKGKDGSDRIKAGTKNLNVSDFLTQELRLPFNEAAPILRQVYQAQQNQEKSEVKQTPRRELWEAFKREQPSITKLKAEEWNAQRESEKKRKADIRSDYQVQRKELQSNRSRPYKERKAALSVVRMGRVAKDMDLKNTIAEERQKLKEKYGKPIQERYRSFLTELANQGDEKALAELRRQRTSHPAPALQNAIEGSNNKEGEGKLNTIQFVRTMAYSVDIAGNVTYYADKSKKLALLVDSGKSIDVIETKNSQAVEAGLRMAVQKFGNNLKIEGNKEFKHQVIDVVLKAGLQVTFEDKAMNAELNRRRADREEQQARGKAFIESQRQPTTQPPVAAQPTKIKEQESERPQVVKKQKNRDAER